MVPTVSCILRMAGRPLQIGAILDLPSNQVRVELFRARQSLRRALRDHDESGDTRI